MPLFLNSYSQNHAFQQDNNSARSALKMNASSFGLVYIIFLTFDHDLVNQIRPIIISSLTLFLLFLSVFSNSEWFNRLNLSSHTIERNERNKLSIWYICEIPEIPRTEIVSSTHDPYDKYIMLNMRTFIHVKINKIRKRNAK